MSRARPDERPTAWMLRILSRTPPAVYGVVVLPVVVVMAATVWQPWLPPSDLLRDSQVVAAGHADASPAYGLISNVGIVVLALAGGGAVIARIILRDAPAPWPRLLLWTAVLTLVLALDDLLLLHEAAAFAPGAGVLAAAAYGLAFLRFVVRFRDVIIRDLDVGLLLLAVGSLGISLVTDLLVAPTQSSVLARGRREAARTRRLVGVRPADGPRRARALQCECEPACGFERWCDGHGACRPPLGLPGCRVRTGQPRHPLAQCPAAPASVTPTSVRWKFCQDRDAVGPRWPW